MLCDKRLAAADDLVQGLAAHGVDPRQADAHEQEMQVRVVDAGNDGLAAGVDDFRICACQGKDLVVASHRFDDAVFRIDSLTEVASLYVDFPVDEREFFHR